MLQYACSNIDRLPLFQDSPYNIRLVLWQLYRFKGSPATQLHLPDRRHTLGVGQRQRASQVFIIWNATLNRFGTYVLENCALSLSIKALSLSIKLLVRWPQYVMPVEQRTEPAPQGSGLANEMPSLAEQSKIGNLRRGLASPNRRSPTSHLL